MLIEPDPDARMRLAAVEQVHRLLPARSRVDIDEDGDADGFCSSSGEPLIPSAPVGGTS
jgi:hypothetical protein